MKEKTFKEKITQKRNKKDRKKCKVKKEKKKESNSFYQYSSSNIEKLSTSDAKRGYHAYTAKKQY